MVLLFINDVVCTFSPRFTMSGRGRGRKVTRAQPGSTHESSGCKCTIHDKTKSSTNIPRLFQLNRKDKKLRKSDVEHLILNKYVNNADKGTICEHCINEIFPTNQYFNISKRCIEMSSNDDDVPSSSKKRANESDIGGSFDNFALNMTTVCNRIANLVQKDVVNLYREKCPTTDSLLVYSPKTWLEARPPELIQLISSICGINPNDDKKSYVLAKAVEQIYYIKNSRLILPLSFRESLMTYTWTKSRQAVTLNCFGSPASSYTTVNRFLDHGSNEEIPMPSGTVRCAYDNNQVIGKTYIITGDNKVPTSVMTSTSYVQTNQTSKIQEDAQLKPTSWMWKSETEDEKEALLNIHENADLISLFKSTRNDHLHHYLQIVTKQHKKGHDGNPSDYIDAHITRENEVSEEKICVECGMENDVAYRICRMPLCGGALIKAQKPDIKNAAKTAEPVTQNGASSFKEKVTLKPNEVSVKPGEPEFVNPNSYETISKVMRKMGNKAGVERYGGNDRHWIFLECDGLPYKIMRDLMDNVFLCGRCNTSFYGEENFNSDNHRCYVIHGEQEMTREFDWIVPVMGLLHLEMNAARSFLNLNWDVFVGYLAYSIGFESPKAQAYCKRGSDHHKTWDLIQIMYIGLTQELLVPYVRHAIEVNEEPSVQGYWLWSQSNTDYNYCYVQEMTLTFLHGLILFRQGVRHNNVDAIFAGRLKFEPLFFGQNHPRYQDILFRDMHDQVTSFPLCVPLGTITLIGSISESSAFC